MKFKMYMLDGLVIVESNLVMQFYFDFDSGGELIIIEMVLLIGEIFLVKVKYLFMQVIGVLVIVWSVDEKKVEGVV